VPPEHFRDKLVEFLETQEDPSKLGNVDEILRRYDTAGDMFDALEEAYSDKEEQEHGGATAEKAKNGLEKEPEKPPDDRPMCQYGKGCYRRNPQHWQDFQHPEGCTPPGGGPSAAKKAKTSDAVASKPAKPPKASKKRSREDRGEEEEDDEGSDLDGFVVKDGDIVEDQDISAAQVLPQKLRKRAKVNYGEANAESTDVESDGDRDAGSPPEEAATSGASKAIDKGGEEEDPWGAFAATETKKRKGSTKDEEDEDEDEDEEARIEEDNEDEDEDEDEDEAEEVDKEDHVAIPVCKYGKGCFRKNPQHFLEFAHPWKK